MSAPVAIAVVSWNTRDLLARCLESLRPDVERGAASVHVVDNASSDGSAEMVRDGFRWAELIASQRNVGFGAAVNLVAERTRSEWIAAANADIAVSPGALAQLLAAGAADSRAGALAPRLVLPSGADQHSVYAFPTLGFLLAFNLGLHRVIPRLGDRLCLEGHWHAGRPRIVDWAVGAFLLVRRSAWDVVGGFDPAQWMYAEDIDLAWRLARAGFHTRYVPAAVVDHRSQAATEQAFGSEPSTRWMRSTYDWYEARFGWPYAKAAALINLIGAIGRYAVLTPGAAAGSRRHASVRAAMAHWARIHARALTGRTSR